MAFIFIPDTFMEVFSESANGIWDQFAIGIEKKKIENY